MATHLEDLVIEEVSLVEDPANEDARVVIMKARTDDQDPAGGSPVNPMELMNMNLEAIQEALDSAEQRVTTVEKQLVDKDAELATLREQLKAKEDEIARLTAAAAPAPTEEEVMKSLPEPVRKQLERAKELEVTVAKMQAEAEEREAVEKARKDGLPQPDKLGPALLRVAKNRTTEDDVKLIEGAIKAAASVGGATAAIFKSFGSAAGNAPADGMQTLVAKAREKQTANPKLTQEQAIDAVLREHPDLYTAATGRA